MPSKLDSPVLSLDMAMIRRVDSRNVESLHSIWTVFSHCAASLQEGRRLENLSWRLWNRETLCCDSELDTASTVSRATKTISPSTSSNPLILTNSNDLEPSNLELHELGSTGRGREKHITSDALQRMVMTINERKDLQPLSSSTLSPSEKRDLSVSEEVNLTLQSSTVPAKGRLVSEVSSLLTLDISAMASSQSAEDQKKKPVFALGGSSGDDSGEHFSTSGPPQRDTIQQKKRSAMFSFGGSSVEDEGANTRKLEVVVTSDSSVRRQTETQEEAARRADFEEAIDDVSESDEIDESAIDDDDDSSEWEDSVEGSGNVSADEKNLFQRVDSRANLTSRRSLITTMLHQHERRSALANAAMTSKSETSLRRGTNPTALSREVSPDQQPPTTKQDLGSISEIPRSAAQPIVRSGANSHNLALSPRTTRRNMLASELTVSLRQHLLWERKQKTQTVNTNLTRRHTSLDVEHLRQYPETSTQAPTEAKGSWDEYFAGGLGEYNSRGW